MVVAILRRIVTPSKYCFSVIDQSFVVVSCPKSNLFSFFVVIFSSINPRQFVKARNALLVEVKEGVAYAEARLKEWHHDHPGTRHSDCAFFVLPVILLTLSPSFYLLFFFLCTTYNITTSFYLSLFFAFLSYQDQLYSPVFLTESEWDHLTGLFLSALLAQ